MILRPRLPHVAVSLSLADRVPRWSAQVVHRFHRDEDQNQNQNRLQVHHRHHNIVQQCLSGVHLCLLDLHDDSLPVVLQVVTQRSLSSLALLLASFSSFFFICLDSRCRTAADGAHQCRCAKWCTRSSWYVIILRIHHKMIAMQTADGQPFISTATTICSRQPRSHATALRAMRKRLTIHLRTRQSKVRPQ